MTLADRRVVLGVSGGIACYKACTIARRLTEKGAAVDVVLTASAQEFVGPVTFEALTHRPVLTSLWQRDAALAHIELAQHSDLILVAPATANLLARAAQGLADDFLTALLLARTTRVAVAPAMNDEMFAHDATTKNLDILRARGWVVVGPAVGPLAEGQSLRPGRMSEPEHIVAIAERILRAERGALAGKQVLVTAGPTREAIDPVRVVTNRSSGRMGYEVAAAAYGRGADVTLISGPTSLDPPFGVRMVSVENTADLRDAVGDHLPQADLLVMAAAPADYLPEHPSDQKRPRTDGPLQVTLLPTDDVLEATRDRRKPGAVMVGFALETGDGIERARTKLARKHLNMIALNMANETGSGFEVETNDVTLVMADTTERLPLMSKREVAERLLDAAERML
ncbi:MAG: bifunctional phosphopantothenoylcysteine decarboxylase/phosphopantothenate--cysteine ligase CoaBC [Gemmatimonadetes bacterium]|nr:bifunctional phosphopantothenoylcysteine decarboxylase/phosphopantothenate--cysteine ligase CoaBC [Gemmatimonadota bacterium]